MRFAVDTGGTFTDLLVEDDDGRLHMYKAPTTPADPVDGVLAAFGLAAADAADDALPISSLAAICSSTARRIAINADPHRPDGEDRLPHHSGHPDILVFREAGRSGLPFDYGVPYPEPYVPRALTFEVPERIGADGRVLAPARRRRRASRSSPSCWRPRVSRRSPCACSGRSSTRGTSSAIGELLAAAHARGPGHAVAQPEPVDPRIPARLVGLHRRLAEAADGRVPRGLERPAARPRASPARVLVVTSQGGVMDAADVARAPIHAINSGPAMAPVAGAHYAAARRAAPTPRSSPTPAARPTTSASSAAARIPWTRETWIGPPYRGHMTGFPSVDVRSIGAGGG